MFSQNFRIGEIIEGAILTAVVVGLSALASQNQFCPRRSADSRGAAGPPPPGAAAGADTGTPAAARKRGPSAAGPRRSHESPQADAALAVVLWAALEADSGGAQAVGEDRLLSAWLGTGRQEPPAQAPARRGRAVARTRGR